MTQYKKSIYHKIRKNKKKLNCIYSEAYFYQRLLKMCKIKILMTELKKSEVKIYNTIS